MIATIRSAAWFESGSLAIARWEGDMCSKSPLGEFLRARRLLVTPAEAETPCADSRRRTPGLRREEVAMSARVSVDYYTRLEQGRQRHPSEQVIDALARVFRLDPAATAHLHDLARPRACKQECIQRSVAPDIVRLMEHWTHAPALVVNHRLDVLVRNRLSTALWKGYEHIDNLIRFTFLNPQSREFFVNWEGEAAFKVAHLRAMTVVVADPSVRDLAEEVADNSDDFRRLWARHDVGVATQASWPLRHREFGDLNLWRQKFPIENNPGHLLFVAQAKLGSPSERMLVSLADFA
ncbi:helix-turn-helix transcriptional regulator [Planotetraspora kaengkrachanensis]|uniref:Transcriptional regulator n=1 Tax=Planotetraspora kaengkrachanensis TaxID=575193 RepID=A0A8J3M3R7_9ACTN|nr:helix-turn-helix transcriptional regulator [Planotetraspora kaengkrachanensis]GIG78625.1 transcriptional regulator [Planotetraspora kaengkrachanensis]